MRLLRSSSDLDQSGYRLAQALVKARRMHAAISALCRIGILARFSHPHLLRARCDSTGQVDAHVPGGKFSVFKAKTLAMKRREKPPATQNTTRPNCGCVLQLNILNQTGSGEHKFKARDGLSSTSIEALRESELAALNFQHALTFSAESAASQVLTLMTAAQEGSLRYGHQTGFNVRPMSARIS
eukprot:6199704-Pleurochrysis_carterae.AAC.1